MFFGCELCSTVWDIQGDLDEIKRLILQHPRWSTTKRACPFCAGKMVLMTPEFGKHLRIAVNADIIRPYVLTPTEAFNALCGLGMPEQVGHALEAVKAYLLSSRITNVRAVSTPTDRVVLNALELDNGLTIHLTANPHGACVLKITRRGDVPTVDHAQLDVLEGAEDNRLLGRDTEGASVQERGGG